MYLKSVEIYGFKSFANKVKINLTPGVTAIVGPNGCGKSNVVDSIKWSIGEMSWKSLRMPSMMDVIFAGTTKRQPLNMAEVTLTFDNEERKINFDFNEVSVTRKIYRSEESEYFINKTECRLKDIREMFLGTGIGSEGYSIIDQGEVEDILSATPERRRELIEEVAGVSKYKSKREEALKRMEKVEYDLNVLANSTQIIDEQIKKLDAEAKRARLQQKYKEELREAEVAMMTAEISANMKEIALQEEVLRPLNDEINEINSAVTAIEAEAAAANISMAERTEEEKNIFESWSNVKTDITRIEGNIVKDQGLIEEIRKQLEALDSQEKRNAELETRLVPGLESGRARLNELKNSFESVKADYEKTLETLRGFEKNIYEIDLALSEKEKAVSAVYQQEMDLSRNIASLESTVTHLNEASLGLEREKNDLTAKKNELESRLVSERKSYGEVKVKSEEAVKKMEVLLSERAANLEKTAVLDSGISEKNSFLAAGKSRLETMMAQAEKDSYWVGLNISVGSGVEGVRGSLRHLISFSKEDKIQIEESLGKFMDAVVVANEEAALKCIEKMKYAGKGRCRFIVMDKVPSIQGNLNPGIYAVLGKISVSPEYGFILSHLLSGITVSEGGVKGDFWLSGGSGEASSNEPYWGETDQLKEEISAAEAELARLSSERTALIARNAEIAPLSGVLDAEISALRLEANNFENALKRTEEELAILRGNFEVNEKESSVNSGEKIKASEAITGLRSRLDEIKASAENIKNEAAALKQKRAEVEASVLKYREEAGFKSSGLASFNKEIEIAENGIRMDEQRLNEILGEKNLIGARREEFKKRIEEYSALIEGYRVKDLEERNNLKDLEIKKSQIAGLIEEIKNALERLSHKLRENKEILNENAGKKQKIEIKINTLKTRTEDSSLRLSGEWNVKYEEVREKYENQQVDPERVAFLRKRIENMGAVNMTAPQEYDALVNRFNMMNSQVEDLNKAKSDLRTAINRINDTTRDNFRKTFDSVQEYFKQIYSTLFNGGEAKLVLTNPDDLLETGVDIMAHPPGKKLINISQLSGGEKSLTALAMLFSFFCVNPSPFCILDEVDAALDEANVERFVRLIKEFSATTQFMVITHNKRTMEAADILYGVTMEELGVSKVISVDLKRAVDMTVTPVGAGK